MPHIRRSSGCLWRGVSPLRRGILKGLDAPAGPVSRSLVSKLVSSVWASVETTFLRSTSAKIPDGSKTNGLFADQSCILDLPTRSTAYAWRPVSTHRCPKFLRIFVQVQASEGTAKFFKPPYSKCRLLSNKPVLIQMGAAQTIRDRIRNYATVPQAIDFFKNQPNRLRFGCKGFATSVVALPTIFKDCSSAMWSVSVRN